MQNLALSIAIEQQQVTVSEQDAGLDTSPDNNANAIVIKGKDLDALSDDPDQLQDELNALAGPAAGPDRETIAICPLLVRLAYCWAGHRSGDFGDGCHGHLAV